MAVPGTATDTKIGGGRTIKKRWLMGVLSRFAHKM